MERAKLSAPEELKEIIIIRVKEEWKIGQCEWGTVGASMVVIELEGCSPLQPGIVKAQYW